MKLAKSIFLGAAAALAVGSAHADNKAKDNDPGFNALDKNNSGYLSRKEAAANPDLARRFKQADTNHDGKLSRSEYLRAMTRKDAVTAKNKVVGAGREVKQEIKAHSSPTSPQAPASPK